MPTAEIPDPGFEPAQRSDAPGFDGVAIDGAAYPKNRINAIADDLSHRTAFSGRQGFQSARLSIG